LGEDRVAFQVLGEGPDLVLTMGAFGHVDLQWEDPGTAVFLRRLASFSRLILFDRRGTGASDPLPEPMPRPGRDTPRRWPRSWTPPARRGPP